MDENTAYEQSYLNGKEYMRQSILNMLRDAKGRALGVERSVLSDVIEAVTKLEVRP